MASALKMTRSVALLLLLAVGLSVFAPWAASAAEADPLATTWTHQGSGFTLTLSADGAYRVKLWEWSAKGTYGAADGLLTFANEDGQESQIPYVCDGKKLILLQKGQSSLVLTAPENAPSAIPNAQGVLPPAADDRPAIAFAYAAKAVVTVELKAGSKATEYCFTCRNTPPAADAPDWLPIDGDPFRTFKCDGDYYIFVRDERGWISDPWPITVDSGYLYPLHGGDLTALRRPLSEAAEAAGSSVEALNEAVAADIARAGMYTRVGAVTSAVSAVSHMAELGYTIPYQGQGSYQERDDWGFNPNWGAKLRKATSDGNGTYWYTGMQCVGSINWAMKMAGLDTRNSATGWRIGLLGETRRSGDNRIRFNAARSGDFIQVNAHYEMVVDRVDTDGDGTADAYLLFEMEAPHLTFLLLPFTTVQYRQFFNMDALYADESRQRNKSYLHPGAFRIPREDFPAWLQEAAAQGDEDRALDRLMLRLGTAETMELISQGR